MEKFSTSSSQSKPLLILSLVVSLLLHVGGFYLLLKHPPTFLIAKEIPVHELMEGEEENDAIDFVTHQAFQSLIIKEETSNPLSTLHEHPQMESVKTPFIITERAFVPTLLDCAHQPPPLPLDSYTPSLIENAPFFEKKPKEETSPSPSKPLVTATPRTVTQKETEVFSPFYPEKQSLQKHFFDSDNFRFTIDAPLPSTPPLAFHKETKNTSPLSESPFATPKEKWSPKADYTSRFFASFENIDLSNLTDAYEELSLHPKLEEKQWVLLSESTPHETSFDYPPSYTPRFNLKEYPVTIKTKRSEQKKHTLPSPPLSNISIKASLSKKIKEELPLFSNNYRPQKEGVSPFYESERTADISPFTIPSSSQTLAFKLSDNALSTDFTKNALLNKKSQSFQQSALTFREPKIANALSDRIESPSPPPAKEQAMPLPQTDPFLDLALKHHAPSSSKDSAVSPVKTFEFSQEMALREREITLPKHTSQEVYASLALATTKSLTPLETVESQELFFTPSSEHQKTPIPLATLPKPSLKETLKSPSPVLNTSPKTPLHLKLQQLPHDKVPHKELQTLAPPLPCVQNRTLLRPEGKHLTLINRKTLYPQTRALASKEQLPLREKIHSELNPQPLKEPIREAFIPPEPPLLAINNITPSLKKQSLEYEKTHTLYQGMPAEDLPLPYLGKKSLSPTKQPIFPKEALDTLLAPDTLMAMVPRTAHYPNTRAIVSKNPCPSKIRSTQEHSITAPKEALPSLATETIESQAKEILEDYDQENRHSSGLVALASPKLDKSLDSGDFHTFNQNHRLTQAFLSEIPSPSKLETVSFQNAFETEVHYTPREDGNGYYFAIKMKPTERLYFEPPPQNIIFVIDGSSTIKKERFNTFKEGVMRALPYLNKGDTFNILVADAELIPMSKTPISWNKGAKSEAQRFLDARTYRGFFINYDAFHLINQVTPYFDKNKENIIVLITDGNSLNSIAHHKGDLQQLAQMNKGNVSIFTASASQNNNLSMLDLVTTFNNGETMYAKTNISFPRKLAVLVKHIGHFVAKDIHIQIASKSKDSGVEFFPNEQTLPSLYSDTLYMVYGTIKELKGFDLVLQGKTGDHWIHVKQPISFENAEKASYAMKRNVALQQAYICYDYFLQKNDPYFLKEAETFLEPYSIPTVVR